MFPVLTPHHPQTDQELDLELGQSVSILSINGEWAFCETFDANRDQSTELKQGWVPINCLDDGNGSPVRHEDFVIETLE